MSHLSYVFKLLIFTFIVMIIMQAHLGKKTIETHAEEFIRTSNITAPARDIAYGGFIAFKHYYHAAVQSLDGFVDKEFRSENSPGRRKIMEFKRSMQKQDEQDQREDQATNNDE